MMYNTHIPQQVARLICIRSRCRWSGFISEALQSEDPFNRGEILIACPGCREQTLRTCCMEPDCVVEATCGIKTPTGYQWMCWIHSPTGDGEVHVSCPFCGDFDNISVRPRRYDGNIVEINGHRYWRVECLPCGARTQDFFDNDWQGEGRSFAIAAWHRRDGLMS